MWSFSERPPAIIQVLCTSPIDVLSLGFQRAAFIVPALKPFALKTQSQIQRKTVKVYKLLFLIIESTGGGILASFVGPL